MPYIRNRSRLIPGRYMKRFGMALGDDALPSVATQISNSGSGFSLPDSSTLTSQLDAASHAPGSPLAPAPSSSGPSWFGPLLSFLTPKPGPLYVPKTGMATSTKIALAGGGALLLVAILARK